MKPLAYKLRPKDFEQVIGQEHLVGKNSVIRLMVEKDALKSFILYGEPGTGKSTIASIIKGYHPLSTFEFNASIDAKKKLASIIDEAKNMIGAILIVDEIHRMKKDIQDYLLPYTEDGTVVLIGLTSTNAYYTVNQAIRSRCNLYKTNRITKEQLIEYISNVADNELKLAIRNSDRDEIFSYVAKYSNGEIRTAINMLESLSLLNTEVTKENINNIIHSPNITMDHDGDGHYTTLSALQKSIRGSDVNASLHYLARLVIVGDLESITRRLLVIAYEDIGLANPNIGQKALAACISAERLGFPEARIPLANLIVELALSPKSEMGYSALDRAIVDINDGSSFEIPDHIKDFTPQYKYPHDYEGAIVKQQYLPDELVDREYFQPKQNSKIEKQLYDRYMQLKTFFESE